jgi:hypothetical protein
MPAFSSARYYPSFLRNNKTGLPFPTKQSAPAFTAENKGTFR